MKKQAFLRIVEKFSDKLWGGGNLDNNSLNPCEIRKNDRISNIIFKDVKEFNIILLILIGIFLVSISGYSSYAIFTDEIVSNNEIKGVVKQKKTPPNPSEDTSGANVPVLTNNMIPVYYDESDNNWKKADKQTAWYNYDKKQWANAVTVNAANRTTYLNASTGTIIPMSDINAMFVWIPRYKYTYMNEKCSDSANQTEETNPECYEYIYHDYPGIIKNELIDAFGFSEEEANDTLNSWKNGEADNNLGMYYSEYIDPNNGYTSLNLPEVYTDYHDVLFNHIVNNKYLGADAEAAEEAIASWKEGMYADTLSGYPFAAYMEECGTDEFGNVIPADIIPKTFMKDKLTSEGPQEIKITFEDGAESTGTIKCTDAINANSDKSQTCTDSTNGGLIKNKSTYTHPAFTFGSNELTGIWVGKFENSATEIPTSTSTALRTVIIKPDVQSWRYTAISYFANSIRNMELPNNIYGFSQSGTTLNKYTGEISGDSNNLDTHMMKNMEWGAVAYLSHSKYGKNSEVFINNSSGFYTGRSGGNVGGKISARNEYNDDSFAGHFNNYGFYTYDGYLLNYNTNEKSSAKNLNKVASTTGNIYGIYDIGGGAHEYVMANMQDDYDSFYRASAETWGGANKPLDNYYDKYSYGITNTEHTRGKLGDATIEMGPNIEYHQTWYSEYAYFPYLSNPWFARGGYYDDLNNPGLFYFNISAGLSTPSVGSRTVLSISP